MAPSGTARTFPRNYYFFIALSLYVHLFTLLIAFVASLHYNYGLRPKLAPSNTFLTTRMQGQGHSYVISRREGR